VRYHARVLALILVLACGPDETSISGSVAGQPFNKALTAYFGGRYLFFSNTPLDCMDVDWVHWSYLEGEDPAGTDMTAVQFTYGRDAEISVGHYDLKDRAQVEGSALLIDGGGFAEYRVIEGELVVESMDERDLVVGTFHLTRFQDTEEGELEASFTAEWCVNLPD
jgi:hypothetical protein